MTPIPENITHFRELLPLILAKLVPSAGGCLVWTGSKNRKGYAQMSIGPRTYKVSRVVLAAKLGQPLGVLQACHSCDNPACCNPEHLFPGTKTDNHNDAVSKGRQTLGVKGVQKWRGELHGRSKLTEEQVREIRGYAKFSILTHRQIGERFGISTSSVNNIAKHRRWAHVT